MDAWLLKHRHEELIAPQYLSANDKFFVAIVHPVDWPRNLLPIGDGDSTKKHRDLGGKGGEYNRM